jgi:membrane fusion protein (multidrug efflux system)
MSAPFHRSLRALAADGGRGPRWGLLAAVLLCGLWGAWFVLFRVSVYAVSPEARIEVETAMHPVEAAVEGEVVSSSLTLGRSVEAGEVLVQLDTKALEIALAAKKQRVDSITAQLGPLHREIEAKTRASREHEQVARAQVAEARARHGGAAAMAEFTRGEAERAARLREQGVVSAVDFARTNSEDQQQRATADALKVVISRIEAESRLERSELEMGLASLTRTLEQLEGQKAEEQAAIEALAHDIELKSVRAPVSGKLGEVAALPVGSVVAKGGRLGAIVPPGPLRVTADFSPAVVLGRVCPGQSARLRLDGFPWVEYGMLPLTVVSVGSEVRDGKVRVELEIAGGAPVAIPMQHGLPGSVEVEVERASPAELILRAVGRRLDRSLVQTGTRH